MTSIPTKVNIFHNKLLLNGLGCRVLGGGPLCGLAGIGLVGLVENIGLGCSSVERFGCQHNTVSIWTLTTRESKLTYYTPILTFGGVLKNVAGEKMHSDYAGMIVDVAFSATIVNEGLPSGMLSLMALRLE